MKLCHIIRFFLSFILMSSCMAEKFNHFKDISFLDLWSKPEKYNGKFIIIDGVIDASFESNEFGREDEVSPNGVGSLYLDFFHYEIKDFSSSLTLYFSCDSKVNIKKLNGKPVHLAGVYWHVDHSIINNEMGVVEVLSFTEAVPREQAGNSSNRIVVPCKEKSHLKGVPGTRNKS